MKRKAAVKEGREDVKLGGRIERELKDGLDKLERFLKKEIRIGGRKEENGDRNILFYLETFLKDRKVATVHPSSKFVRKKVLKGLSLKGARTVVEYGPADGVITLEILERLPKDGKLIAIERNPDFHRALKEIPDPRLVPVLGDVLDVRRILKEQGLDSADRAVSGIPFSFLKSDQRHDLLRATADMLNPGGRFVAYQFTTHLIPLLRRYFQKVDYQFEILNIPPHFIFTCLKGG